MARNIILRLTGETSDADRALDKETARVKAFGQLDETATIKVDAVQAKRQLDEVLVRLKSIPERDSISIRINAETSELDRLERRMLRLKNLSANAGPGNISHALATAMGDTQRAIDTTVSKLHRLDGEFKGITPGIDNVFERISRGIAGLLGRIPFVGTAIKGFLNGLTDGITNLAGNLLPQAASGFIGLIASGAGLAGVAAIILVVAGAISGLIISLGMALIGVVALGVAFVVALAPIALLLGLVISKFASVISGQDAVTAATQRLKTAQGSLKSAILQQQGATQQLQTAQQNAARERLAAIQDEKQATLDLTDAENARKDALLGIQSAKLNAQQARLSLAQLKQQAAAFGLSPGALQKRAANVDVGGVTGQQNPGADKLGLLSLLLQYKQAVLAIKVADQGVNDATATAADSAFRLAQAHAKVAGYMKNGLTFYQPYAQALQSVASGERAVARAANSVAAAQRNVASAQGKLADTKIANAPTAAILKVWNKLSAAVSKVFGPAEKEVFKGLLKALDILSGKLGPLGGPFKKLGKAIGDAFVTIAKAITSPKMLGELKTLITESSKLVGPLAKLFINMLAVLLIIVNAAMPTLIQWVKDAAAWFGDLAKHPKKIRDFIVQCIAQTKNWLVGIKDVAKIVLNILNDLKSIFDFVTKVAGFLKTVAAPFVFAYNLGHGIGQALTGGAQGSTNALAAAYAQVPAGLNHQQFDAALKKLAGNITPAEEQVLWAQYQADHPQAIRIKPPAVVPKSLQHHALGGIATSAMAGIFGEAGPEALIPLAGGGAQLVADTIGRRIVAGLAALSPRSSPWAGGRAPASTHGMHVENVHAHFNQGDSVADADHFSAVFTRRLTALGSGVH